MLGDDPKVTSHSSWAVALRAALAWPVAKRSLIIMVVVGTVLNSINQGDALLSGRPVDWWKIAWNLAEEVYGQKPIQSGHGDLEESALVLSYNPDLMLKKFRVGLR